MCESNFIPPATGKQSADSVFLALVAQPVLEKENSQFKPVKLHQKLTFCHILLKRNKK